MFCCMCRCGLLAECRRKVCGHQLCHCLLSMWSVPWRHVSFCSSRGWLYGSHPRFWLLPHRLSAASDSHPKAECWSGLALGVVHADPMHSLLKSCVIKLILQKGEIWKKIIHLPHCYLGNYIFFTTRTAYYKLWAKTGFSLDSEKLVNEKNLLIFLKNNL